MPLKTGPLKSVEPTGPSDQEVESIKKEFASKTIRELENLYIPTEIEKSCPVFTQLYNLFEQILPCTGHFAGLIATGLSTMCVDADRQVNLSFGAQVGEGKTIVLSQFRDMSFVNFFNRTSYSNYVLTKCGHFLTELGQETPSGIIRMAKDPRLPFNNNNRIDKRNTKDLLSNRIDIVTEGEGIFTVQDVGKLIQLWNALIEQGYWEGGDSFNGTYQIASAKAHLKHGLIIASTLHDFEKNFVYSQYSQQVGWISRMILAVYNCTREENQYLQTGLLTQQISDQPSFPEQVTFLLSHLVPQSPIKVSLSQEVRLALAPLADIIQKTRNETTGKRAAKDVLRLVKGFAWLNRSNEVKYEHLITLLSLLTQCKRITQMKNYKHLGEDKTKIIGYENLGSRLDFQLALRYFLNRDQDFSRTPKEINTVFSNWDGKKLYSEEEIDKHLKMCISLPITPFSLGVQVE